MKTIKIRLEYDCFPIWLYDENGEFIDNELPEFLIGDEIIDAGFTKIQEKYNELFLNDGKEFRYIGFNDKDMKLDFTEQFNKLLNILDDCVKNEYRIENEVNMQNL